MPHGKRYIKEKKKVGSESLSSEEAISKLLKISRTKFDQTMEVHIRLGVNISDSSQNVRGTVTLPHGTGKSKKVAVFCSPEKQKEAKEAGADVVGGDELVNEIMKSQKTDFDIAIAEPSMMRFVGRVAKILGPRGLMPNPKAETITTDIAKAVKELKGGKINFKMDQFGNLHQAIGKVSFGKEKLVENFEAFADAVKKAAPQKVKNNFISRAYVTTTMGPSIRVSKI